MKKTTEKKEKALVKSSEKKRLGRKQKRENAVEKKIRKNKKAAAETKQMIKKNGKILYKLIGAFVVPVCLIILLGILSYQSASKNIRKQYENSVDGTIATVSEYCHLLCNNIEDKSVEIITNDTFSDYYKKHAGKNDSKAMSLFRDSEAMLKTARGTTSYIYSYNVFSENGGNMSSTSGRLKPEAYSEYEETAEAKLTKIGRAHV